MARPPSSVNQYVRAIAKTAAAATTAPPTYVVDACALLRFAQAEAGGDRMRDLLYEAAAGKCKLLMHIINLGEVVYMISKRHGEALALQKRAEIERLPIEIVPFSESLFWRAVSLKSKHAMSYADAFAATLAITHDAPLLTTDSEFDAMSRVLKTLRV